MPTLWHGCEGVGGQPASTFAHGAPSLARVAYAIPVNKVPGEVPKPCQRLVFSFLSGSLSMCQLESGTNKRMALLNGVWHFLIGIIP